MLERDPALVASLIATKAAARRRRRSGSSAATPCSGWRGPPVRSVDLVFLDPPFDSTLLEPALLAPRGSSLPGGFVYVESATPLAETTGAGSGLAPFRAARAGAVHFAPLAPRRRDSVVEPLQRRRDRPALDPLDRLGDHGDVVVERAVRRLDVVLFARVDDGRGGHPPEQLAARPGRLPAPAPRRAGRRPTGPSRGRTSTARPAPCRAAASCERRRGRARRDRAATCRRPARPATAGRRPSRSRPRARRARVARARTRRPCRRRRRSRWRTRPSRPPRTRSWSRSAASLRLGPDRPPSGGGRSGRAGSNRPSGRPGEPRGSAAAPQIGLKTGKVAEQEIEAVARARSSASRSRASRTRRPCRTDAPPPRRRGPWRRRARRGASARPSSPTILRTQSWAMSAIVSPGPVFQVRKTG